jgi:redox-sensitive bicupin YhaK (pirin superfamily)
MIEHRPSGRLSGGDHGWLKAKHHFNFADANDPDSRGWGILRIWNNDTIAPGMALPMHPHRDMEIITSVREGAIIYWDSLGNAGRIEAGDVQVMQAAVFSKGPANGKTARQPGPRGAP